MERLSNSHFGPIDVPFTTGITSLIVQGYFCYRIWIMSRSWSRKTLWICWIIAVVCISDPPCIRQALDVCLNAECGYSISRLCVGGHRSQHHTHLHRNVLSHTAFSRSCTGNMWFPRQQYMYAHSFLLKWPYHLLPFELVMVHTECHGRHSHCGSDDFIGTITLLDPFAH